MEAGASRCRAIGCFTCGSRRRPAMARSCTSSSCCGTSGPGELFTRLEHHYDSPELWRTAMSEHRAVLKSIAARDPDAARIGDAAPSEPGVQAIQQGLERAAMTTCNRAHREEQRCLRAAFMPRTTCASKPQEMPAVGPGEVLLKLGAGGICGSDLHYFFEGRNGSFVVREPLIPGHEASAVVAAIGDGVTRVKVGDKVAVSPSHACGRCGYCRRGPRTALRQRCGSSAAPACFRTSRACSANISSWASGSAIRSPATCRSASSRSPSRLPSGCTRSTAAAICSASRCWSPARARSAA